MTASLPALSPEALISEKDCADYLYRLKWPSGFTCPRCGYGHAYVISTRRLPLYQCSNCLQQTSLIAGTVMEGSRTPLTKWFTAIQLISDPHLGISAHALSLIIRVTYKTAWSILQKLRFAMGKFEASVPLSGQVILNDACYGRPYNSTVLLHPQETPVLIGAELSNEEPIRIAIQMVHPEHLHGNQVLTIGTKAFISRHLAPQTVIRECHILRYGPRKHKKALPLFKEASKWINATFHGLGKRHLQAYFHEFCCRMNLLMARVPVFESVSKACASFGAITYRSIVNRKIYF